MKAKLFLSVAVWISLGVALWSAPQQKTEAELQKIVDSLKWKTGEIPLNGGVAVVKLQPGYRFLDGPDSSKVMTDIFQNPPSKQVGMIFPPGEGINVPWAFVLEKFNDDGYVKDDDAGKLDAGKMLKEMQDAQKEANPQLKEQGYKELEILGWAVPPKYDSETKKLFWAIDLRVIGSEQHSLNYFVRVLGRKGYYEVTGIAPLSKLKEVEAATPQVLSMVEFTEGNRYADFDAKKGDKVATYGIAGLILGAVGLKAAAKLGLLALFAKKFGVVLLFLKKGIVVIVAAFAALWSKIRSIFVRNKPQDTSGDLPPPQ